MCLKCCVLYSATNMEKISKQNSKQTATFFSSQSCYSDNMTKAWVSRETAQLTREKPPSPLLYYEIYIVLYSTLSSCQQVQHISSDWFLGG